MIIELKASATKADASFIMGQYSTLSPTLVPVRSGQRQLIVFPSSVKSSATDLHTLDSVDRVVDCSADFQLSSKEWKSEFSSVQIADGIKFGPGNTVLMAGPCSVETRDQTMKTAEYLVTEFGMKVFRAGAFKPRTSPYSFQGLGEEGLRLLDEVRSEFGVKIISEVKDISHFDSVAEYSDIIQVGTKAMYNPALLHKCGRVSKPILLKRGFMSTIKEFLQAADFIMLQGNMEVILCERGLRNFEPLTRFSLDICGAAAMRELSHLPIVLDPSHSMGYRYGVPVVMQAAAGFGCDGILVETHPEPDASWSDADQALHFDQLKETIPVVREILTAVGRTLI